MKLTFALTALICGLWGISETEARWTIRPRPTTTTAMPPVRNDADTMSGDSTDIVIEENGDRSYHPAEVLKPRLIEKYDQRYLDGHYEFRYVLSNGDIRYERADWIPVGKKKVLAKKGFYSYPMPNGQFRTVFYTSDHNGHIEDSSKNSLTQPALPKTLDAESLPSTTVRPQRKRKPSKVMKHKRTTAATTASPPSPLIIVNEKNMERTLDNGSKTADVELRTETIEPAMPTEWPTTEETEGGNKDVHRTMAGESEGEAEPELPITTTEGRSLVMADQQTGEM